MARTSSEGTGRSRSKAVMVAMVMVVALLPPQATQAHVSDHTRHVGRHIWKKVVKKRVYNKSQADAQFLTKEQANDQFAPQDHTHPAGAFWALGGNAGTDGDDFVGTTDDQALELRVNGERTLRLEPDATSPNVIGGFSGNQVSTSGATIAGGGQSGDINEVTGNFGTVGGGRNNTAGNTSATVGGGRGNTASGPDSTVGGGGPNIASGLSATVGGGSSNAASGEFATLGGGSDNTADGRVATVGGGGANTASGDHATVGGGEFNTASGELATVGGGDGNTADGNTATVGGGDGNTASGTVDTVGGGQDNIASGSGSTVGGGQDNTASGNVATVGGGLSNLASGQLATVPGGTRAAATRFGETAHASGGFGASTGTAQASEFVLRNTSTDDDGTELFLNGSNQRLVLAPDQTLTFEVLVAARSDTGESAGYLINGVIENIGGATSLVGGPPFVIELGEDDPSWDVEVEANDTDDALGIVVDGDVADDTRWVATVTTAQVGFGVLP